MFASDNVSGIHPRLLDAIAHANAGPSPAYGNDEFTRKVERRIADLFERDCAVAMVSTGTAANSIALSLFAPNYGGIYTHPESHVFEDECGAPELFTGGAKLIGVPGPHGKLDPDALAAALKASGARGVHHVKPSALSLTNATEAGGVYRREELARLVELARGRGLKVFVDGARFANAVAASNVSPAELTWRLGIDGLSFGATKNGALAAEAIVVFDPARGEELAYRRKRGGQLWSKHRFLAAQFDAYLTDDLWLANARNANAMAKRMADGLLAITGTKLEHPVEANEVFIHLPERVLTGLAGEGINLYRWFGKESGLVRMVGSFDTTAEEVDRVVTRARAHAKVAAQ